ncbi:acetyl-CoA synthetase-like protein [Coprinopsis marcescibilis]|uniref:Acetyl-CoA synthetase-like protein n=1 Tax=Coprinopsis marcescibilis TaxID=230819 RepID=A0A5C3L180_COPMA|nr:acetyl-CoA synthetase-like protein [Coprinopsis marcescibilis]
MVQPFKFPARSLQHTEDILCADGNIHAIQTLIVDGRLQRVYKNLWPSLRNFWLAAVADYAPHTYIVYEDQRLTYAQVHIQVLKVAHTLLRVFAVSKGDRIAICSRNCPEFLVVFWACHLIGAVAVLPNAWLPIAPLRHCLVHTGCKLVFLDSERAILLQPLILDKAAPWDSQFIVISPPQTRFDGMHSFHDVLNSVDEARSSLDDLGRDIHIQPEDNATVIFTSGTTGLPKGVLSTQRQFLTNVLNVLVGGFRAALRRGEDLPSKNTTPSPQKAALVAVPLFHVTGSTSYSMMATMTGMKIVLMRKWDVEEGVRLIRRENVTVAGGVPSMVSDLIESSLAGHNLEGLLFGGAPAPDSLVPRARKAYPSAIMTQGYGLTETNSIAVSAAGEDYIMRPNSTGRASPVNDIKIIQNGISVPTGSAGEVWIRGPNVMKGYWCDPDATQKVITADGWLRTGDLGYLDEEGFLYIKDRIKDIIIRGGENIDSVSVENALYADPRVHEAAAVGVPDERLGELVAAVVSIKPMFQSSITESALIAQVRTRLPRFAVPVMIVMHNMPFEQTPSGKIIKGELRKLAKRHWELRKANGTAREPLANL